MTTAAHIEKDINVDIVTMNVDEWIGIPQFKYQRNTEARLERAISTHLGEFSPLHAEVKMARLPDGKEFKLDGHTRSLAWERGLIARPAKVIAYVYPVKDEKEALELYEKIDSKEPVETLLEKGYGAAAAARIPNRDKNYYAKTGRFTSGARLAASFARGMTHLNSNVTAYEAVPEFKAAIIDLIDLNPQLKYFTTAVSAAYLLSHRKYAKTPQAAKAKEFWDNYRAMEFIADGKDKDGVYWLLELMGNRRELTKGKSDHYAAGIALACVDAYVQNRTFRQMPKSLDVSAYL